MLLTIPHLQTKYNIVSVALRQRFEAKRDIQPIPKSAVPLSSVSSANLRALPFVPVSYRLTVIAICISPFVVYRHYNHMILPHTRMFVTTKTIHFCGHSAIINTRSTQTPRVLFLRSSLKSCRLPVQIPLLTQNHVSKERVGFNQHIRRNR